MTVMFLQQLPGVPTLSHLQTKTDLTTNFTIDMTVVLFPYQLAFCKSLHLRKYITLIPWGSLQRTNFKILQNIVINSSH